MSSIEIRKVKTRQERKTFVEFHYELYEGNEYDAPGLFRDELENFDEKNLKDYIINNAPEIKRTIIEDALDYK